MQNRRSPGSRPVERQLDHEKGLVYYIIGVRSNGIGSDRMILAEVHTLAQARNILPDFSGLEGVKAHIENSKGVRF